MDQQDDVGGIRARAVPSTNYCFIEGRDALLQHRGRRKPASGSGALSQDDRAEVETITNAFEVDAIDSITMNSKKMDVSTDTLSAIATRFEALAEAADLRTTKDLDVLLGAMLPSLRPTSCWNRSARRPKSTPHSIWTSSARARQ